MSVVNRYEGMWDELENRYAVLAVDQAFDPQSEYDKPAHEVHALLETRTRSKYFGAYLRGDETAVFDESFDLNPLVLHGVQLGVTLRMEGNYNISKLREQGSSTIVQNSSFEPTFAGVSSTNFWLVTSDGERDSRAAWCMGKLDRPRMDSTKAEHGFLVANPLRQETGQYRRLDRDRVQFILAVVSQAADTLK